VATKENVALAANEASRLLLEAANKYAQVIQIKPNFDRARMNWAKAIKALAEVQQLKNASDDDDLAVTEEWAPPADSICLLELRRFLDDFDSSFKRGTDWHQFHL
jgi:hypothetical protein